jgi:hypothetical protein
MVSLELFVLVESPVVLEITARAECPELEDGLGVAHSPGRSREVEAVLKQVTACALDNAAGDWVTVGEALVVAHHVRVPEDVVTALVHRLPLLWGEPL